ncbi:MAG: ATP-dependent helicase HrpB [Dinoroseobacter sp.]|nr:ATP-dependent helicase HrpB [Dinoroseobacter sp.]
MSVLDGSLPVDAVLPDLVSALAARGGAVLQAPPGAGKTTRVPLSLLEGGVAGRIVMLEPRRLAARAAAERMAETLGEEVGHTVGYRIRGEAKVGKGTRVEVVTEGILTRMLQSDPDLPGIGAVIFDEFHERSLNADLGLALALEVQSALRDDLWLVVMSATLDAAPVARIMGDVPVITSQGRSYPVETRHLPRPLGSKVRFEPALSDLVAQAVHDETGSALVFCPGEGEIRRVAALLEGRLPTHMVIRPLFGAMPLAEQRAAIAPVARGRKLVLATSIAETSLTIEDVRVVIDGGRARRARFDPASGMARLVTEKVSRAEADQRRGRAGRVASGVCYRLWTRGEEGALVAFPPAEIEVTDLSVLALELALWGAAPGDLPFLTQPPDGAWAEAVKLGQMLGALDPAGRITEHGRAMAARPLHPRLAHMLLTAGRQAAELAALLSERDLDRQAGVQLERRLEILRGALPAPNRGARDRVRAEAKRLAKGVPEAAPLALGAQAALAYPDRIGLRRKGEAPRWLLSGGKGAAMAPGAALAGSRLLVATDLDGDTREATIRQAAELRETDLRALFGDQIVWENRCDWSRRHRRIEARSEERLGALVLDSRVWQDAPPEARSAAALEGIRDLGLSVLDLSAATRLFLARVALCRAGGMDLPDVSESGLLESAEAWLLPLLGGVRNVSDFAAVAPLDALKAWIGYEKLAEIDRLAPPHITTPLGRKLIIDYSAAEPEAEARVQEFFGTTQHPVVGPARVPVKLTLLSPAQRPVAVTSDLPGFWTGGYVDLRKDMRGRYPKHPWPEDPSVSDPTLRAKRRG